MICEQEKNLEELKWQVNKKESTIGVAVGFSRKWDARSAGREVAEDALNKLGSKPDFFLLFATIHYEKYGGFKEFLKGVWDVLPEKTPLIGGTVAGFINPEGCFTRGATALAVSYPNMVVSTGYGLNSKRNPKKAASDCHRMIKNGLNSSQYRSKFMYTIVSGTKVMEAPFIGRKNVIVFKPLARLVKFALRLSTVVLQKGPGREEEILEELTKRLPDYSLAHMSTIDDMYLLRNYQFFDNKVLTDAVTVMALQSDVDFCSDFTHGGQFLKKLKITGKSLNDRLMDEINNKPAVSEFTELTGLDSNFFFDDREWQKRFPYFPLGYIKNGRILPRAIVMVLNESLFTKTKIESDRAFILSNSGGNMFSSVKQLLGSDKFQRIKPSFGFVVSCGIRLTALGYKIYSIRDLLLDYFGESPFLLVYSAGEGVYSPDTDLYVLEESININSFGRNVYDISEGT